MSERRRRSRRPEWSSAVALGVVPLGAYFVATALAEPDPGTAAPSLGGHLENPLRLLFVVLLVGVPCLAAIWLARTWTSRVVVAALSSTLTALVAVHMQHSTSSTVGLALLSIPMLVLPLGALVWIGETVRERRRVNARSDFEPALATIPDRLAALGVDVLLVGAAVLMPVKLLSDSGHEIVAVVVGIGMAAGLFTLQLRLWGATIGQRLVRVTVVDVRSGGPVSTRAAALRSLIIVTEVAGLLFCIGILVVVIELLEVNTTGRTYADRLARTAVMARVRSS